MANLGQKSGIYYVRFRYAGKEYKKSCKIRDRANATAAKNLIELTIHRLFTGQITVPPGIDPGDFIVSGGTATRHRSTPVPPAPLPTLNTLIEEYKASQKDLISDSYHDSQAMHLRHLVRHLGTLAESPIDRVGFRDLDGYIKARLAIRHPHTAERERITLLQFNKWVVAQGYLPESPATGLKPIKGGIDRPPFRTADEIERIIARGGLTQGEILDMWECLFLTPDEIALLLAHVRRNGQIEPSYLLHAIPAYTGMRRGEILRLRWIDVNVEEEYLIARSRKQSRTKTETVRRIDMHPELTNLLEGWRESNPRGQFVICDRLTLVPIPKDRANRLFWAGMRESAWCLDRRRNWYKVGFHTYRHSFASNLASRGVDQRIIDEWMGHQTEAMRKRYRHLFPKDRRSAIECFSLNR